MSGYISQVCVECVQILSTVPPFVFLLSLAAGVVGLVALVSLLGSLRNYDYADYFLGIHHPLCSCVPTPSTVPRRKDLSYLIRRWHTDPAPATTMLAGELGTRAPEYKQARSI